MPLFFAHKAILLIYIRQGIQESMSLSCLILLVANQNSMSRLWDDVSLGKRIVSRLRNLVYIHDIYVNCGTRYHILPPWMDMAHMEIHWKYVCVSTQEGWSSPIPILDMVGEPGWEGTCRHEGVLNLWPQPSPGSLRLYPNNASDLNDVSLGKGLLVGWETSWYMFMIYVTNCGTRYHMGLKGFWGAFNPSGWCRVQDDSQESHKITPYNVAKSLNGMRLIKIFLYPDGRGSWRTSAGPGICFPECPVFYVWNPTLKSDFRIRL